MLEWADYDGNRPFGAVGWLAGDPSMKFLASTVFVSISEAVQRDEELSSGMIGRTHEEVMEAARRALETQPRS